MKSDPQSEDCEPGGDSNCSPRELVDVPITRLRIEDLLELMSVEFLEAGFQVNVLDTESDGGSRFHQPDVREVCVAEKSEDCERRDELQSLRTWGHPQFGKRRAADRVTPTSGLNARGHVVSIPVDSQPA